MRKLVFLLALILSISSSLVFTQNTEIINKYRPTEVELYKNLDEGIKSDKVKFIKLLYNEKGNFSYSKEKSFNGKGKTVIFELYGNKPKISLTLKKITFSGFDKIIFNLFNISDVILDSCVFKNIQKGVVFEFKENVSNSSILSKILIDNCKFVDSDLKNRKAENYAQLQFMKNSYAKGLAKLKNVTISNCSFKLNDSKASWLIKSKHNVYPQRSSIDFFRRDFNTAYSNILIRNNKFEANALFYRTEAITFANSPGKDFMSAKFLYSNNVGISIINNIIKTTSNDPGHAIYVEGPYSNVNVDNNKIYNYGMSFNDGKVLHCGGAIHLYGSRNAKYSDDILGGTINGNTITAIGAAIKMSGGQNIDISANNIKILPWSKFYINSKKIASVDRFGIRVLTGAYLIKGKQSRNISVKNNVVNCNNENACFGIMVQSTKDFSVLNNTIIKPTNFGIIIYGHKGERELGIGKSIIESNTIDYGNLNKRSLNTKFYNDVNFAAIKIHRMNNGKKYKNESLIIKGNKIIDISNTIPKASVVDLTNSQLIRNTKSDISLEK